MAINDRLQTLRQVILDTMFPPSKREREIRRLKYADITNLPPAEPIDDDFITASFSYQNEVVRNLVQAAKYDGSLRAAEIMGALLYDDLLSLCASQRLISRRVIVVPIPLHKNRYQQRGFNQCRRIIRSICKQQSGDDIIMKSAIKKTRPTPAQASLTKTERKTNLSNCFALRNEADISGEPVIIVDDVTTTGATFREARSAIKAGNPEAVLALAFAH